MISSFMCVGRDGHSVAVVKLLLGLHHAHIEHTHTHLAPMSLSYVRLKPSSTQIGL